MCVMQDHRAHCLVHDRDCVVNKARCALRNPESLVIANAGNCCQGWSSEGKRARGAHLSQVPLAMWVCQHKALAAKGQEGMFFQECTPFFDIQEHLIHPLESSHRVVQVVAGPRLLGWPASRDRRLSAGLSLESLVWVGPATAEGVQADFESLFARRPELNGSIFLQEDEGVVTDWCLEQLHKKRSRFIDELPEGKDLLRALLPPGQLQRAEQYDREKSKHAALDGTMFCDVEHWLNSPGPDCGPMLPCLLTHGTLVELSRYRFVMPSERFLSLGFHSIAGVSDAYSWPLADFVLAQSERTVKHQAGNSQSLPAILAWHCYVLCNTIRREKCSMSRMGSADCEHDDDAESEVLAGVARRP